MIIKVKLKSKRVLKRMAAKNVRILYMPAMYALGNYSPRLRAVLAHSDATYLLKSDLSVVAGEEYFPMWYIPKQYIGKVKRCL